MKRAACLFEKITAYHNIRLAFLKTLRGQRTSAAAVVLCQNVDRTLAVIQRRLASPPVHWGEYHRFVITDPKKRTISAAPIEDRIIHHAIMNILEPVFERPMIFHSYACRHGKGMHAAVRYAFARGKAHPWFLKLDIRAYFDSIDHGVLKRQLAQILKDRAVLDLLGGIIGSYHTSPGRGVPIGNVTSQFFANLYLSPLDHYILEELKPAGYVRYMDDFVLWASSISELRGMLNAVTAFVEHTLGLQIKPAVLGKTAAGLPFLGFMIKKKGIYLLRRSKKRIRTRMGEIQQGFARGVLSEERAAARVLSVYAAVRLARTRRFRVHLWNGTRFGYEPCETGRQLEQQCGQLHGLNSEQQHPE
ncbi:MAG: reverse transcriptase/maturase family protein [Treponema sp.]|nr:reverse transcriptase/maturase family protein [Treponema sp.]